MLSSVVCTLCIREQQLNCINLIRGFGVTDIQCVREAGMRVSTNNWLAELHY